MSQADGVADRTVFVVGNDSVARARKVKSGTMAEGMTEIMDGLSAGEKVVAVGKMYLKDGDPIGERAMSLSR
ncbi:MAG: hypothetical protein ACREV4_15655 [Gammaproteobacteria bacterium]